MPDAATKLIVFSDDWGRHPSSCQHLIRRLLPRYPTLWVNTTGTRRPTLSWGDLRRAAGKLRPRGRGGPGGSRVKPPANLSVIAPLMWPGFRSPWQRRFNARRLTGAIHKQLGPRKTGERRVAVTTLPITADLVGKLDVDRWVYYCVDDFSAWPGLDAAVLNNMEREQVAKMDAIVAVSSTLQERLSGMGRGSELLTHGIDPEHWSAAAGRAPLPRWWPAGDRPIYLFWGLIDARLDAAWCRALAQTAGRLILVGPRQSPPAALTGLARVLMPGPLSYEELPAIAAAADVLVMPYDDLPVSRAMQPLKFKEYLAAGFPDAGKPVVARRLPATEDWCDAADVVDTAEDFVRVARQRAAEGLPESQRRARSSRLPGESWEGKAAQFERIIGGSTLSSG